MRILSINIENIHSNKVYIQYQVQKFKPQFIAIQEHWLFRFQIEDLNEIFPQYEFHAKCADDCQPLSPKQKPRGYGGVAILWRSDIQNVSKLDEGSERTVVIEVGDYTIVSTYLPCRGSYKDSEFLDEIAQVREICTKYNSTKLVLTGDLNVDLKKQDDARTRALVSMVNDLQLYDVTPKEGHTYSRNNFSSKIDYVFINAKLKNDAKQVFTEIKDDSTNTSPHMPILITISPVDLNVIQKKKPKSRTVLLWDKMDLDMYQDTLEKCLNSDVPVTDPESAIRYLIKSIDTATNLAVPVKVVRDSQCTKPWNDVIKDLFKQSKDIDWCLKNAKVDEKEAIHVKRKAINKHLRAAQRIQTAKQRDNLITEIMQSHSQDQKLFFKLIKRQRKTKQNKVDTLEYDGQTFHENLLPIWTQHFRKLAQPADNEFFDDEYLKQIKQDVLNIHDFTKSPQINKFPITTFEIKDVIKSLKKQKAKDEFGMCAEHVIYGGQVIADFLTKVVNAVIQDQQIPPVIKSAINHPIPKKGKDTTKPGNARGISICPIVGKVVDSIQLQHQKAAVSETLVDHQFGFTELRSPSHATLLLSEIIAESKESNQPLYICTLDIQKAFDVICHDSLLRKLFDEGLPSRWWQLKKDAYKGMTTKVIWDGEIGEPYKNEQGNRQGGRCSTSDFKVYIVDGIRLLIDSAQGIHIGRTYVGVLACADDLILASNSLDELQHQISLINIYANKQRLVIHPEKSSVSIRGIKKAEMSFIQEIKPWAINNRPMTIANQFTHLGVEYNMDLNNPTAPTVEARLSSARATTYSLMGSGFHGVNGLKPTVSLYMFEIFVISRTLYSLEAINIAATEMEKLEIHQRNTIRRLQSLPKRTSNAAIYILSGTLPMEARIHKKRLSILPALMKNEIFRQIIPRQLATKSIDSPSWIIKTQQILRLYDLPSMIDLLQQTPSKDQWKKLVSARVERVWKEKIEKEANTKKSLKFMSKSYRAGSSHTVWQMCPDSPSEVKKAAIKARLLTNTYTLQANRAAFNQTDCSTCLICKNGSEDVTHFLTECSAFDDIREPLLKPIVEAIPYVYENHPSIWGKSDLCQLILDPLHPNVPFKFNKEELFNLETNSRKLCYSLHKKRAKILQYRV